MNATFPLYHSIFFQLFPIFSPNVHSITAENSTIMITFSMHSVVRTCSPFFVSQIPQPPIILDNGFIQRFPSFVFPLSIIITNCFLSLMHFCRNKHYVAYCSPRRGMQLSSSIGSLILPYYYGAANNPYRVCFLMAFPIHKHYKPSIFTYY